MPEMRFQVRWPDQSETDCYSPSLIIKEFLTPGQYYDLNDFVARTRRALEIADERVFQKYGFYCTAARQQLKEIEDIALHQPSGSSARVLVVRFSDEYPTADGGTNG